MAQHEVVKEVAVPLVLGIAASVLPWLLEKRGVEMPSWILTFLGLVTIMAVAYALLWPFSWLFATLNLKNPSNLLSSTLVWVLAALLCTLWATAGERQQKPLAVPTYLRLQFNAPGVSPIETGKANIKRWYTLHNDL